MALEISGKLIQLVPAQTGTGKNGPWKKCDFVIETTDKFPKKICVSAWNELSDQIEKATIGSDLQVSFDISSREYNGRWYTDVKAWKISVLSKTSKTSETPASSESSSADLSGAEVVDDLPF